MLGVYLRIWAGILAGFRMGSLMGSCIFRRWSFTNILVIGGSKLLVYFIVFDIVTVLLNVFSEQVPWKGKITRSLSGPPNDFSGFEQIWKDRSFWNFWLNPKRFEFFRIILNSWLFAIGLCITDFGASFETEKSHSLQVGSLTSFPLHFENPVYKLNSPRHRSSGCGV